MVVMVVVVGKGYGEEKKMREKPIFLLRESPATFSPLASHLFGRLVRRNILGQTHRQLPMQLVLAIFQEP